jgi:2-dehydropantoate 2-reductase
MRVAVMGAGGLGGYFGALLARAGNHVIVIARGEQLDALRTRGLTLHSRAIGDVEVHPDATDHCEEVGPVDLVMMCVESYDLESASAQARPLVGRDTVVLPVQNGVDAAETIGRVIGGGCSAGRCDLRQRLSRGAGRRSPRRWRQGGLRRVGWWAQRPSAWLKYSNRPGSRRRSMRT